MARFIRNNYDKNCVEVTSYEDSISYGCETCGFDQIVEMYYVDKNGKHKSYEYNGTFAYLIRNLTDDD